MFSDKQHTGTNDWHVEAYATGDATGYCQSHTVPVSLCKPTYTNPNCDLTALQGYPSAGRIWLYLVVHETEVPHVITQSRAKARHTRPGEK